MLIAFDSWIKLCLKASLRLPSYLNTVTASNSLFASESLNVCIISNQQP